MKLFSKITYAQRNELLKKDAPLLNVCEPITFQEAERRMLRDGERAFANSQEEHGDEATSVPTALNSSINNNNINNSYKNTNATHPENKAETSRNSRIASLEGWILVFSPPWLFTLKILAKNIC